MTPHKVIFDCDPGVDDAMALLFLHRSAEVDLVGVTTTFGNGTIEQTTRNALYLVDRFGMNCPVSRGAGMPLVGETGAPPDFVHGQNALGNVDIPDDFAGEVDPRPAHQFIIEMVKAAPGEVSIVAVGRMTNLALALRQAPEIAGLVKQVVVMGGAFGIHGIQGNVTPAAEANILGDPEATDEVTAAAWPMTFVGLDVTQLTFMPTEYLADLARHGGEIGTFIWDVSRFYEAFHHEGGVPSIYVHDSSAVAYLLRPELYETRTGSIRVATEGVTRGMTVQMPEGMSFAPNVWEGRPSHKVCTAVDAEGMRQLYRSAIIG